ncbi:Spo0E family sporulation regulatory protein-aspartic acid phosphatase [Acetivibrio cellulolyticus]|uniref:Spo0E family sporulation regulatory protein-aspartic acid phosphatase n=1 Tax=Acetivibrio cellulolyticus TaxID=35830 RepID=UPI0001E2EC0E|nr:Spo0E family sporulation regulatory protein-aspartic acid phosphatase [Acetivibrio cellulolyticus]
MSNELMYYVITGMHLKLNRLIEIKSFDLLDEEVQHYSRRLDKVLDHYNKFSQKGKQFNPCYLDKSLKCASL